MGNILESYTDYKSYREELEQVRKNFLEIIDTFPGVHLQTSRVKTLDSLLEKVITKRHQHLSTGKGIIAELREDGYRSIHYIISYQHTYIEIQVRTIYDEAWSDCDHLYVYKHEENKRYATSI